LLVAALAVLLKAAPDTTNQTIVIIGAIAVALLLIILWISIVEVWQDEALARRKAEEALARKAEMQGMAHIDIGTVNPNRDQNIPASFITYDLECVNNGSRECQITQVWIFVTPPNATRFGLQIRIDAQTVDPEKIFRAKDILDVQRVLPDDLRASSIEIELVDAVGKRYPIRTVVSNRILSQAECLRLIGGRFIDFDAFGRKAF